MSNQKQSISRQRRWQLKKREQGLCERCGKEPRVTGHECLKCAVRTRNKRAKQVKTKRRYLCMTRRIQKGIFSSAKV